MSSETGTQDVQIDFLMLADRAEILNGKLYMMGGAWDRRYIRNIETPIEAHIVVGVLVPWNLTNQPHELRIRLDDEDGNIVGSEANATVNVGRPVQAARGQTFRAIAALTAHWTLPKYGPYSVIAEITGQDQRRVVFYAVDPNAMSPT